MGYEEEMEGGGLKVFGEEMSMDNEAGPTVVSEYICLWFRV